MMNDLELGHSRIKAVIDCAKREHPGKKLILIEMLRMFGDILHATIIARHFRHTEPNAVVVLAMSERFSREFDTSVGTADGPHYIANLPHGPDYPADGPLRVAWTNAAKTIPGVTVITPGVHPYGWKRGLLTEAIFENAGITQLKVPRTPWLPVDISDYAWHDQFLAATNAMRYVAIEYNSHSLQVHSLDWYAKLAQLLALPVVSLGGKHNQLIPNSIDGRGCTFRQAKVIIMRAKCFVGCASGNGVVAVSNDVTTPMVEIVEHDLAFKSLGYISNNRKYAYTGFAVTPEHVASLVNKMCEA